MSERRESIKEAVRQQRLLLAKTKVREDDLDAEIGALQTERAALGDGGDELRAALGAKIAELQAERGGLRSQRDAVIAELAALDKLEGKLPAMEAHALAREALAFTGAEDAAPPPARMSEEAARAELARLRAQRAGTPASEPGPAPSDDAPPPPRKRTL